MYETRIGALQIMLLLFGIGFSSGDR